MSTDMSAGSNVKPTLTPRAASQQLSDLRHLSVERWHPTPRHLVLQIEADTRGKLS